MSNSSYTLPSSVQFNSIFGTYYVPGIVPDINAVKWINTALLRNSQYRGDRRFQFQSRGMDTSRERPADRLPDGGNTNLSCSD